jgi:hypothetical protein
LLNSSAKISKKSQHRSQMFGENKCTVYVPIWSHCSLIWVEKWKTWF